MTEKQTMLELDIVSAALKYQEEFERFPENCERERQRLFSACSAYCIFLANLTTDVERAEMREKYE
jgi:hypothetical protein